MLLTNTLVLQKMKCIDAALRMLLASLTLWQAL